MLIDITRGYAQPKLRYPAKEDTTTMNWQDEYRQELEAIEDAKAMRKTTTKKLTPPQRRALELLGEDGASIYRRLETLALIMRPGARGEKVPARILTALEKRGYIALDKATLYSYRITDAGRAALESLPT